MIIRAKDQASRVINSVANSAIGDFSRVQREAVTRSRQLGINMADMRVKYDRAILQSRERLFAAQRAGDTVEAKAAQERIKRLQLIRDAQALNIRQAQIAHRQQQLEIRQQLAAKQAMIEHNRMLARTAGVWIAVGAGMALVGGTGLRALHGMAMGAVEYQRQAALTLTQVREQGKSIQDLQRISNNVASSVGVPFERLQTALYDIFSSTDVKVKDSQFLLQQFAKAAVAGQTDIVEAGGATISFMNAFKVPVKDINRLLDIQFKAVQVGRMTYEQFAANVGKAIPATRAAGQSIEFLAGAAAFLTRNGLSVSQAFISIARAEDTFLRKPVQSQLRALGIESLTASGRLRPINQLMAELAPHFAKLDDFQKKRLFEKIFGGQSTIQARRFFELAIRDSQSLNSFIGQVTDASGEFAQAYGTMSQTIAVRTERMKNQWQIFKNTMGADVAPALGNIIDKTTDLLTVLNRMEPGQRKAIGNTLAYGAAALTAVGGVIALTGALKLLRAGLAMAAVESAVAGRAIMIVGAAATSTAGIIALLVAAIAIGTIYLAKNINNTKMATEAQEKYALGLGRGGKAQVNAAKSARIHAEWLEKSGAAAIANGKSMHEVIGVAGPLSAKVLTTAAAHRKHSRALDDNKGKLFDVTKAIQKTYPEYEHLAAKAGMSARSITRDFEKQAKYFRDWSVNVQKLIRDGVDPKFVRDLSKRGPEFVAAYAKGTTREVQRGEKAWREAHAAMSRASKTNFDKAGAAARDGHRQTKEAIGKTKNEFSSLAAHANLRLKNIHDERVGITAVFGYKTPPKLSMHAIVGARGGYVTAQGIHRRMAAGGMVYGPGTGTSDSIPAPWLSNGEFVVNAASTSRHRELLEAINSKGYAAGGVVTDLRGGSFGAVQPGISAFLGNIHRTLEHVAAVFQQSVNKVGKSMLAAPAGGNWGSGSWQRAIIELRADRVPFNVISTFRRGAVTRSGSQSYHALNRAVDLTGPNMLAIFESLADTNPTELIYAFADRYKARGGWRPIGQLDRGTWRDHMGHVHAAYHQGGRLPEDVAGVGRSGQRYAFRGGELVVPPVKLYGPFSDALRNWTVPWLKRIAVGVEHIDRVSRTVGGVGGDSINMGKKSPLLTAQQLVKLPDAARWAYVKKYGLPKVPTGFVWAEDFTYVPLSFYSKTSYDRGGRINEDIIGMGRSGRTYGFQRGETVVARGGGDGKSVSVVQHIYTNEIHPQQNAQMLGWELTRRL